jgi:anthranilate synthase/aminodeoxychorismate synthase-like glutamine amidotransferase
VIGTTVAPGPAPRVLVIDNYDSFTWNLVQSMEASGARVEVVRNDAITSREIAARGVDGLVISPGPGRPEGAGVILEVIRLFSGRLPILGVCLGHQAIGQAFGGRVVRAPSLMHGKTSPVHHDGRSVFAGLPDPFQATRYHSLVIDSGSVPAELEISATTEDGVVMGLRHRRHPTEGVQFHPESVLTAVGDDLLRNFLRGLGAHRWAASPPSPAGA